MRKSFGLFLVVTVLIIGVWLLSDSLYLMPFDQRNFAISFTQISGLVAIGLMAFATLLAIRPVWLEPYLNGLDKMYRLHKWVGIVAMVLSVAHWLLAQGPNGHHAPPGAAPATDAVAAAAPAAQGLFSSLEGPAHGVAQPALFLLLALSIIALVKWFPYHVFALLHRLVPAAFLVLVLHSVVLMKPAYWTQPIGWLMILIYGSGVVAAVMSLFRLIGMGRKATATVTGKTYFPEVRALLVDLQMDKGWQGHQPGQFAFVKPRTRWLAHPFTIASPWTAADPKISFIVKELGDSTQDLEKKLPIGARLTVEGPYGNFTFADSKQRQIWVSGGIGITPFVARMKYLTQHPDGKAIDLFHSDPTRADQAQGQIKADAARSGVNLHLHLTDQHGRLTGAAIRAAVPDWKSASVWFCGPSAFAAALKLDLMRNGLASGDFHHELFEMR